HGSCGMGINEGSIRTAAGFGLFARDVFGMSAESLAAKLSRIRNEYGRKRISEAGLDGYESEYMEMLSSETVLKNLAEEMLCAAESVIPVEDETAFLREQENLVFESGQGLLLDGENNEFAPHVTASRTGLHNVVLLLKKAELKLDEACYVSRSYVTRHGAGALPCECAREDLGSVGVDITNVSNNWQGAIRYAKHVSVDTFYKPIHEDLLEAERIYPGFAAADRPASLFITHLNETDSKLVFNDCEIPVEEFMKMKETERIVGRHYLSYCEENTIPENSAGGERSL
nr:adenylosuccinate synthetase [Lachnospiraceae bacterium]